MALSTGRSLTSNCQMSTKTPVESYGITYVPTTGIFKGIRVAVMRYYGFPLLFKQREFANKHAAKIFGRLQSSLSVKVELGVVCAPLVRNVVEIYSGKSYQDLLPLLIRCKQADERHAERSKKIRLELLVKRKRTLTGTGMTFLDSASLDSK
jgi:hypothetical protein